MIKSDSGLGRAVQRTLILALTILICGCGASTKIDEFIPTRIVSVGDALSYQGTAANGYNDLLTVNGDGTVNNWLVELATNYGITFDPTATAFAKPNARVADLPSQLNGFVPQVGDMLVIQGGNNDILFHTQAVINKTETPAQALSTMTSLGYTFQLFARAQLSNFSHILILNANDLKGSMFAQNNAAAFAASAPSYTGGITQFILDLTRAFNSAIISNAGTYASGQGVRLFDAEGLLLTADLQGYGITTAGLTMEACSGFNVGLNCNYNPTTSTGTADPNYAAYLYADDTNLTPVGHRLLGNLAYLFLRSPKGW
jgi:hypothetical protein